MLKAASGKKGKGKWGTLEQTRSMLLSSHATKQTDQRPLYSLSRLTTSYLHLPVIAQMLASYMSRSKLLLNREQSLNQVSKKSAGKLADPIRSTVMTED